jgi:guanylate kinase
MFSSQVTGKAIIFSAPSGAGKTTLVRYLLSEPALMLAFSVSATSREKRGEEVDGKDYHFLSNEEFQNKIFPI